MITETEKITKIKDIADKYCIDKLLPYSCRYKFVDYSENNEILWVTQESDKNEAKELAEFLKMQLEQNDIHDWTVKITVRDEWDFNNPQYAIFVK